MSENIPEDVPVRVRVVSTGIRLEIAGEVLSFTSAQAREAADAIAEDPSKYGLGSLPTQTAALTSALRKGADIYEAFCLGAFRGGSSGAA